MFLYNMLFANIKSRSEIILTVASFRITILLITEGRTAHSQFKILIKLSLSSICNILQSNKKAYLINLAKLFIWNKALMIHKFAFEVVNHIFHDIIQIDKSFGEKVFVFRKDFH